MSPAQLAFWQAATRRASGLQPDLNAALLRAFAILRDSLTDTQLYDAVRSGDLDRLLTDDLLDRAFIPYRQQIRAATQKGFQFTIGGLPKSGKVDGVLAVAFDHLSPDVITAIETLETKVITSLAVDIRETVRAAMRQGLQDGIGPREIARGIRGVIGLGPMQLQEVENYRAALQGRDGRSLSSYTLRDKRLKPTTSDGIDRAVEIYRKRRIALNAETNARTATLDSFKRGQQLAWQDANDSGVIPDGYVMRKQWIGVGDSRERPEHVIMNDQVTDFDAPYSNGEMVPGESTWNCRCVSRVFLARA